MLPPSASEFKELVRSRTDLVSLIGETVSLQAQRGGQEFVGLCPFHDDHRPSMRVYPDRQSFRCWSCNTGGDCFAFVMLRDHSNFPEALEWLATRAGLEVPKHSRSEAPKQGVTKQRIQDALTWAEAQFHECLIHQPEAAEAREYLRTRGFLPETVSRFRLGYHPQDWNWLLARSRGQFTVEQLQEARLIGERTNGNGHYDYFFGRLMFPIRDITGQTVAFGGRVLPSSTKPDQAKYWNSPESSLFAKSRLLYGLEMAKDGLKKSDTAVVVEGYTDCILAHQAGLDHFVGTLGTALTDAHVALLKRFVRKVVLIYDGDAAGQNATDRSLPRFLAQELDLRILTLPDNLDPADAILERGAEWFRDQVQEAVEVWEYQFRRMVAKHGLDSVDAAHRVLGEMLQSISLVPGMLAGNLCGSWKMREDLLLGRLSQRLGIAEKTIRERLNELRREKSAEQTRVRTNRIDVPHPAPVADRIERLIRRPDRREELETELLATLMAYPHLVRDCREQIQAGGLTNPDLARLLQIVYNLSEEGLEPGFDRVMITLDDPDLRNLSAFLIDLAEQRGFTPELAEHVLQLLQPEDSRLEQILAEHSPPGEGEPIAGSKQALLRAAHVAKAREQAQQQLKSHWKEISKSS